MGGNGPRFLWGTVHLLLEVKNNPSLTPPSLIFPPLSFQGTGVGPGRKSPGTLATEWTPVDEGERTVRSPETTSGRMWVESLDWTPRGCQDPGLREEYVDPYTSGSVPDTEQVPVCHRVGAPVSETG